MATMIGWLELAKVNFSEDCGGRKETIPSGLIPRKNFGATLGTTQLEKGARGEFFHLHTRRHRPAGSQPTPG